ncbi:isoflavone reductase family protein-like protein CipA [Flagelloscypha sp. PMI_526]|nr:isoflavone reductase family protein-like protein CipA [Flagelloscypha sp. PMI_526]
MSVKKVMLLGAGGNLGPAVLDAFLASKTFEVTVLTRPSSKSTFPPGVDVVKAEYTLPELQAAFTGQDVVISMVGGSAFTAQKIIVDAAIAAGVKRFFPSEFGALINDKAIAFAPVLQEKKNVVDYLISKESSISWTAIQTNAFFDWGLKVGWLGFDLAKRTAELLDGGITKFHATNVPTIAKAIVATLSTHEAYEKTKNQYVRIASYEVSQRDILQAVERATEEKWVVTDTDTDLLVKSAQEKLAAGAFEEVYNLIRAMAFGKIGLGKLGKLWNDELGLPKEDLDTVVKLVLDDKRP